MKEGNSGIKKEIAGSKEVDRGQDQEGLKSENLPYGRRHKPQLQSRPPGRPTGRPTLMPLTLRSAAANKVRLQRERTLLRRHSMPQVCQTMPQVCHTMPQVCHTALDFEAAMIGSCRKAHRRKAHLNSRGGKHLESPSGAA